MKTRRLTLLALLGLVACSDDGTTPADTAAPKDGGHDLAGDATPTTDHGQGEAAPPADSGPDGPKQPAHWTTVSGTAPAVINHTATLLADGRVLIVGGQTHEPMKSPVPTGEAYLYDPGQDAVTPAGSLTTARYHHTATLLDDGRVLIAGGSTGASTHLDSAEIFDPSKPSASAWSAGPALPSVRGSHTATRLSGGKVLLIGGEGTSGELSSMVIFDPSSNGWMAPTAVLKKPRTAHSATALQNGKIFIAGGSDGTYYTSSAEVYDPSTGTTTLLGASLSKGRLRHTADLLPGGKVLIVGGYCGMMCTITSDDLYDPATDTMAPISHLGDPPAFHASAVLKDGRVLVSGGMTDVSTGKGTNKVAAFTTSGGGMWQQQPVMASPRYRHTATTLADGSVLVVGGQKEDSSSVPFVGFAERFYP